MHAAGDENPSLRPLPFTAGEENPSLPLSVFAGDEHPSLHSSNAVIEENPSLQMTNLAQMKTTSQFTADGHVSCKGVDVKTSIFEMVLHANLNDVCTPTYHSIPFFLYMAVLEYLKQTFQFLKIPQIDARTQKMVSLERFILGEYTTGIFQSQR